MEVGSAPGAFVVGNSRSSLRGRKLPIVRGGGGPEVYHWRQIERCGGTGTGKVMWSSICLALAAVSEQACTTAHKKDAPVSSSRALPESFVV